MGASYGGVTESTAGTSMVKDINPRGGFGSIPLIGVDGILYFSATDGEHGMELWRTDGTDAGTWMVKDVFPGSHGSRPANLYHGIAAIGGIGVLHREGRRARPGALAH